MLLQLINIVAGFILALPGLKEYGTKEPLEKIEVHVAPWKETVGFIALVIGAVGLLDRLGLMPFSFPELGSSFPQVLPAILIGALLAFPKLERYQTLATFIKKLFPYTFPLGLLGIAVGLGSLLFGCFLPMFCRLPF